MSYATLLNPPDAGPHNPEWHKLRREGVTASEIAIVLGISPWESPFSLFWQKVNGWDTPASAEMSAGRRAEQVIADWYADVADPNENLAIQPAGLYAYMDRPWQLATPDRLLYATCGECGGTKRGWYDATCIYCFGTGAEGPLLGLVECKYLIDGWDGWGEPGTDQIPVHYRAQALWQLDVLDVDEVHVAAWHGADMRIYQVRRDERDLRIMRDAAERFLTRIADDQPPPIDGHPATLRALKAVHPELEDREQEISPAVADGYRRARALKARADRMADLWEARLRAEMGNARRAVSDRRFVASRSIYDLSGEDYELHTLDGIAPRVDKLNPARSPK